MPKRQYHHSAMGALAYWYQALTVRRGFPPPLAPYQKRAIPNPELGIHPFTRSYHRLIDLPYGAYMYGLHGNVLQSYPFSGKTYPFPIDICQHRFTPWPRQYPRMPLAFGMSTLTGPKMGPLYEGDLFME